MGLPEPSNILPKTSRERGNSITLPKKRTLVFETSTPVVPSNAWTTALSLVISSTCPLLISPEDNSISTNS
ncbi:hypothetical protein ES703_71177 [subsurface metagenome]